VGYLGRYLGRRKVYLSDGGTCTSRHRETRHAHVPRQRTRRALCAIVVPFIHTQHTQVERVRQGSSRRRYAGFNSLHRPLSDEHQNTRPLGIPHSSPSCCARGQRRDRARYYCVPWRPSHPSGTPLASPPCCRGPAGGPLPTSATVRSNPYHLTQGRLVHW
jgi:hypothetical protein